MTPEETRRYRKGQAKLRAARKAARPKPKIPKKRGGSEPMVTRLYGPAKERT